MEEFPYSRKEQIICPRKSLQDTKNKMLNQPKRRSQRIRSQKMSINKQCSDDKDEENPLKMGLEEGYGAQKEDGSPAFWWDDNDEAFAFRYNKDESYIPPQTVSEVPFAILDPLFSDVDRKTLDSYTDEDLIRLQNQMSFGSAMVAKYISDVARSLQCSIEVKERENKKLRRNNDDLDKKLRSAEKELNKERSKFLEVKKELVNVACGKLQLAIKASGERIKQLKASVESSACQTKKLEEQLAAFRAETDKLRANNNNLMREIIPAPKLTAAELSERFKTEEHMDAMYESGRQGFNFFRSAFLRRSFDSVAQVKKTLEELTYEVVCEEECALEGV